MHKLQNKFEDPSPQFLLIGWILNLGGHQWKLRESSLQYRETISTRGAALEWPFESRTKSNPRSIGPSPWTIKSPLRRTLEIVIVHMLTCTIPWASPHTQNSLDSLIFV